MNPQGPITVLQLSGELGQPELLPPQETCPRAPPHAPARRAILSLGDSGQGISTSACDARR